MRAQVVSRRTTAWLLAVAVLFTLLNAWKPLTIDDAFFYSYARQIAAHPTDPYGFELLGEGRPKPALHVIAPVVHPYWWAAGIAVFGDVPILWKFWMFPFALILTVALHGLFRRIAPGLELPLLWMVAFSPAVLPNFNLMLDVPAMALGLFALERFTRACDSGDWRTALFAGIVAGVAMQTKYTAVTLVAALLAYGWIYGSLRLAAVAAAAASAIFVGWECILIAKYGESHFMYALLWGQGSGSFHRGFELVVGLVAILGAVAPGIAILASVAMRASPRALGAAIAATVIVFAVIPALPALPIAGLVFSPELSAANAELFLFIPLGIFVVVMVVVLFRELTRDAPTQTGRFLLAWLSIEVMGFALLNPFMATRRTIGICVVLTAAAGAVAARRGIGVRDSSLRLAVGFGIALGCFFQMADVSDAVVRRSAAARIAEQLKALDAAPGETVWVAGRWAYQFYTERLGMRQLVAGESRLASGDWVVVAGGLARQPVPPIQNMSESLVKFRIANPWPWSTVPWAYAGPISMRRQPEAQLIISIHQMQADETLSSLRGDGL
ncbi:MAG: glycosyltransferase family 39 protein [Myxococcales bacterium]|nr:glycosyltransferase family 39 protein [Myxococcales bacterium]